MDIIYLLHTLRRHVVALTKDESTIMRLDVDSDVTWGMLNLVIITSGVYFLFTADANDFRPDDHTGGFPSRELVDACTSQIRQHLGVT